MLLPEKAILFDALVGIQRRLQVADEHVIELFEEVVVVDKELAARLVVETYEVFELLAEGSPAGVPTSERVENWEVDFQ